VKILYLLLYPRKWRWGLFRKTFCTSTFLGWEPKFRQFWLCRWSTFRYLDIHFDNAIHSCVMFKSLWQNHIMDNAKVLCCWHQKSALSSYLIFLVLLNVVTMFFMMKEIDFLSTYQQKFLCQITLSKITSSSLVKIQIST
jgi:hypothetical protein